MSDIWQPSASLEILKSRARLLQQIRSFMADRNILEVETPVLCQSTVTDPHIQSFKTDLLNPSGSDIKELFLHTSPEYAMKRLLAAGSGPIYQITKVFRNGEAGRLHNPEFTMLEWYQPGYDHHQLMEELDILFQYLQFRPVCLKTYARVFLRSTCIDPHQCKLADLSTYARKNGLKSEVSERTVLLDYIFSHCVVPTLGVERPELIYDYPACQAALAKISDTGPPVAERFELFINGMEIANGFHELMDADEQRQRFEQDNAHRQGAGRQYHLLDEKFLAALASGLPDCAGVAVGIDRLLMAIQNCDQINQVIAFPIDRA
jgi:elongation factor P--(R)-beta-lysine ligase